MKIRLSLLSYGCISLLTISVCYIGSTATYARPTANLAEVRLTQFHDIAGASTSVVICSNPAAEDEDPPPPPPPPKPKASRQAQKVDRSA